MAVVYKTFNIALDVARARTSVKNILVEGDTANKFVITLTDDGVAVDLSTARVVANFSNTNGTFQQSSFGDSATITVSGTGHNIITIPLATTSVADGNNLCELQILSDTLYDKLITTARISFTGRKAILNDETIAATTEYAVLVDLISQVTALTVSQQSDWDVTDDTLGTYIRNKPVAGTDFIDAIPNLTAEATIDNADFFPYYDTSETAHRKTLWSSIITAIRTALFGSSSGLLKANGSGTVSAATENTDFAAAAHASRHAAGAADAVSPASIGAEKERLTFVDQSVSTSDWATYTASGTEETKIQNKGYTYKRSLALSGVLATMNAIIVPSEDKADCGTLICNTVITYDGGIQIYAKGAPSAAFILLRIDCFKAVG